MPPTPGKYSLFKKSDAKNGRVAEIINPYSTASKLPTSPRKATTTVTSSSAKKHTNTLSTPPCVCCVITHSAQIIAAVDNNIPMPPSIYRVDLFPTSTLIDTAPPKPTVPTKKKSSGPAMGYGWSCPQDGVSRMAAKSPYLKR